MVSNFYRRIGRVAVYMVMALLVSSKLAFAAGSGVIQGKVLDKQTNDELPGASVLVKGTNIGASTDLNGSFVINNAPSGEQTLVVSYVGYNSTTLTVEVPENGKVTETIHLEATAIQGKAVVVTAQAVGQMQSINQELSANQIVNVVSAEKMKELPDANIAESIGRLPGISLERNAGEAYAVVIRGLSPQYNEVTIEGVPMTSTNYYDRGIDLSLLGDDLVKGVEVSKTLSADMDADALGGTVNLTLRTAQPGFHYDVRGNGGYDNLRSSYDNYKFSGSASTRILDDHVGILAQGDAELKQLPSNQFNGAYAVPVRQPNGQFTVSTQSAELTDNLTKRHRYGASLILDYKSDLVDVKFFNVYDQKSDSNVTRNFTTNFSNNSFLDQIFINETKTSQRVHSLQALFKFDGTELPISLSYTKGDQSVPNGQEFDFLESGVGIPISSSALIYGSPSTLIRAQGVMNPAQSTLWNLYDSNTELTDGEYDAKIDWKIPFKFSDDVTGNLSVGGKYHGVSRTSSNTRVYYNVQYGGSALRRINFINEFAFLKGVDPTNSSGIPAPPFLDPGYTTSNILGYPIGPGYDVYKLSYVMNTIYPAWLPVFYDDGVGDFNQDYNDNEKTYAGYVMGQFNIGERLTLVPGIRYQEERTDISAYQIWVNGANQNGLGGQAPRLVDSKRDNPNWFPSVNIKYKATDNIQLLAAAYRSVSLPSYGQVNPLVIYQSSTAIVTNNPLLRPSTAWNYDLGASLYSNVIGLFTADLFYKEISDLIYNMQNYYPFAPYPIVGAPADINDRLPGKSYFDSSLVAINGEKGLSSSIPMNDPAPAYLRGIEFSWQTHLWYLPGLLSGIVLDLNLSLMSSSQMYPSFAVVGPKIGNKDTLAYQTTEGSLQNQPKAIYNAILGWDYKGFSSRFSFRYQQQTLTSIDTRYGLENSYYDNVLLVDISLKQQLVDHLALFANATDVNNHIDNYYFSHPAYLAVPAGQLPTSGQTYGWDLQVGATFSY
jgi:TonB-dependent receptor